MQVKKIMHKFHLKLGVALLFISFWHGVLAAADKLIFSNIMSASLPVSLLLGGICFISAVLLFVSYLFRHKLKSRWLFFHRKIAVLMFIFVLIHVLVEIL